MKNMRKDNDMATFFNRATLTYGANSITSNTVSGEIVQTLSLTKTALSEEYIPGSTVTYVIALRNSGITTLSGLTLTDDLGRFTNADGIEVTPLTFNEGSLLYYVNGDLTAPPTVTSTDPLTLGGITVPAGGSSFIVYSATVNSRAPLEVGSVITNTATVSGNSALGDISASETISAAETPLLSILKSLSPETVTENGTLTYTLLIENRGNAPVTSDLSVSDTFDPILENITVTYNGTVWTEGTNYTYDEASGLFTTLPGAITLPAATYVRDPATGEVGVVPGSAVIRISGTI